MQWHPAINHNDRSLCAYSPSYSDTQPNKRIGSTVMVFCTHTSGFPTVANCIAGQVYFGCTLSSVSATF